MINLQHPRKVNGTIAITHAKWIKKQTNNNQKQRKKSTVSVVSKSIHAKDNNDNKTNKPFFGERLNVLSMAQQQSVCWQAIDQHAWI